MESANPILKTRALSRIWAEPLLQLLDPRANERILDLGCGDGALTEKIAAARQLCVIGVDASAAQVPAAQQRGLLVAVMDGQRLGFKPRFGRRVYQRRAALDEEPAKVIEGVANCLKPGSAVSSASSVAKATSKLFARGAPRRARQARYRSMRTVDLVLSVD